MSPRRRRARATRKLVEWHQLRLAVLLTRESPVGRTFDVCGAKVTVREQIGDVLLVDVLPPTCPVQFITVNATTRLHRRYDRMRRAARRAATIRGHEVAFIYDEIQETPE